MSGPRRSSLFTEGVVVAVAAVIGLRLGLTPIKDNSAFTHLATGIEMVSDGWLPSIPRADPYTYTALGREWIVQSWLPSWVVGAAERAFGIGAVLLLSGLAYGVAAALMASVARTGSSVRTTAVVALTLPVASQFWAPRPLMIGVICFALALLVLERGWRPWWLVPIGWVWVQSHGSYPLGLLFYASLAVGAAICARNWRGPRDEVRLGTALLGGIVLGAANPLGPRLLLFPLTALDKRDVFSHIAEWKPLGFGTPRATFAIVCMTLAVVICIRRRVTWRVAVPMMVFGALAATAQRNVVILTIVMAWGLSHALRAEAPAPLRLDPVIGLAVAALGAVLAFAALQQPALNTEAYPVAAIRWAEQNGRFNAPHRVLSKDFVGNYLELRHGPVGEVFIDDRYDMFPARLSQTYFDLLHGRGDAAAVVDRFDVDTVIWPRDDELAERLRDEGWQVAYRQELGEVWVVLIRSEA